MRDLTLNKNEKTFQCRRIITLLVALFTGSSLLTSSSAATSGDYVVRTWETDQGLPESSATSMVQDEDGFLWFGTFNGLVRFDGIGFKILDRSNLAALPSPAIVNLHLDQSKRLWVSTMEGLIIRDGNAWTRYDEGKGWKGNYIRHFAESPDGTMYVTTFDGQILEFSEDRFRALPSPPGVITEGVFAYAETGGRLWVLDSEFFGTWSNGRWTEARPASFFSGLSTDYALAPSNDGYAWLIDDKFLWRFKGAEPEEKITLPPECQKTWSIFEDSTGKVWIASLASGLFFYDRIEKEWGHYTSENLLSQNSLRFVFQDKEKHLWVGSSGGGLMQFQEPRFSSYGIERNLTEPRVKSLSADPDGNIFTATFGGGIQALIDNTFQSIPSDEEEGNFPQSILVDTEQRIWAGTLEHGLFQKAKNSATFAHQKNVIAMDIRSIFQDTSGAVWIGAKDIIHRISDNTWNTLTLPSDIESTITSFAQKPGSSETYIGSSTSGLFRSDGIKIYRESFDDRFDSEGISSLLFLNDEELLIGTFDLGLIAWSRGRVIQLNHERDFPGSGISSITKNGSEFWIGTNRGIVRMTEEDLTDMIEDNQVPFRGQVFTQSDGLSSIECPIGFQPTATIDHNGTIWFASGKGLNSIAPERLKPNEVEPMIVFDNILYTDRSGQIQDLQQTDQKSPYQLPPDHSNLTIHFTSPSFASPEKIEFEIILKAPKQNIIKRQTSREIHFHRLEPGDYQLSIRPRNSDGFWAKDPGQVYFTVSPFYWQTLGFQASAGATAILLTGTLGFLLSRRQMSREVKFVKSERRLKNLLEETQRSALIGGWEYDTETKQLYWTQEAFSIHETQSEFELDLDRFYQFYRSNDQIELRAAIGDAQRTGQDFDLEVQTHAHGIWLRVTGKAVDSPSRKIYGCFQNIQHQKDREQFERNQEIQARQSQKLEAIGTLAGGIAHDFNNILTGIRGYTDLLAIDLDGDSKSREHVRELQDAATRATDLVKQILTYSRPGSEKLIPLNLIKVSRHALKLLRASIPSSVEIKTTLPSEIPLIAGSDSQIHQLLVNLFTNAAQSIGDLGTISCTLYSEFISQPETHSLGDLAQGTYAIFEIRDTGKGIETESIDRIFDPFFTTKQNAGGTGLGLSVVLGIVKSHQGAIRLRSDQSRGTTFHVYLPCIDHQTEVPLERPSLPKAGKGQHIMLIDDDKDVIDVTSKMIKRLGYSTECYLSSTTAVDAFHKATESYALVITDFTMPIMRGDVVVERIREIDSITPIILVSGNLEGKIPDNLDPSGRLHWLQKPFEYKELARVITKAIELGSNKSN